MLKAEGSKIRILSTHVANKIAAGEVVERPASVVKELLENAFDAEATRIDIIITAGGRNLISVADNGRGMNRDDAILAAERQATSKIKDVDDIEHIATFGFRGEALASIASVARFTLRTRQATDDFGTEVAVVGGQLQDVKDCGCPPGTCIEVRDLFFNVPARRKFLRTYQTEQAYIRNTFLLHAIAHPHVALTLKCDGDLTYEFVPCDTLHDRIMEIAGHEEMDRLLPIEYTLGYVRVFGYAATPDWTRADRIGQRVYINRRPATAPAILNAISEAYPKMEGKRKPILYLFVDLPPEEVDVNVHPTKREVRFRNTKAVRDAVIAAITKTLNIYGTPLPADTASHAETATPRLSADASQTAAACRQSAKSMTPVAPPPRPVTAFPFKTLPADTFSSTARPHPPIRHDAEDVVVNMPSGAPWTQFRIVGRLSPGYVLLETNDGYTALDPAAAHERVLYERLLGESGSAPCVSQQLLIPQTIELTPIDYQRIKTILPILNEMGFTIEAFGQTAFIVNALPDILAGTSCESILIDTAAAFEKAGSKRGRERWREEIIAKAASRAAVRTRRTLEHAELSAIIVDLAGCVMPYTSPFGRPTMIYTSFRELNRRFGRS